MPSARAIVQALGGRWTGSHGMCRCPAHEDRTPSLSVSQEHDRILVHCFTGCSQDAVLAALKAKGLWELRLDPTVPSETAEERKARREREERERAEENEARAADARSIWNAAKPIAGTLAETYLRNRGITGRLPPTLRFAPCLRHAPSGLALPALICAVQSAEGRVTGVQRIYLAPDGSGKAAVQPAKMTLGILGDGAVRLSRGGRILGIGEGPETCLSAVRLFYLPVWAVLGAGRLGALTLPEYVQEVVIFADRGEVGERQAELAAELYEKQGRATSIALPKPDFKDFNDQARGVAMQIEPRAA